MDSSDYIIGLIILAVVAVFGGLFVMNYYDTSNQRQCREKLAVAPAQYRSAADIALICK